jgi:hypothetical protein
MGGIHIQAHRLMKGICLLSTLNIVSGFQIIMVRRGIEIHIDIEHNFMSLQQESIPKT